MSPFSMVLLLDTDRLIIASETERKIEACKPDGSETTHDNSIYAFRKQKKMANSKDQQV